MLQRVASILGVLTLATGAYAQDDGFDSLYRSQQRTGGVVDRTNIRSAPVTSQNAPTSNSFRQSGGTPPESTPWSGHWWPRNSVEMSFLSFSQGLAPLQKYDTLVYNYYGQNPGAAAWEADPANGHNDRGATIQADWSGHCNGLAAAAILEPEPRRHISVPLNATSPYSVQLSLASAGAAPSGLFQQASSYYRYTRFTSSAVQLTVADMKGWLCEAYSSVYTMNFSNPSILGNRVDDRSTSVSDSAYQDIYPHCFHYLLQKFVKKGQPIIVDVDAGPEVNNHPLYQYNSSGVYYPASRRYAVTTEVLVADYAPSYHFVGTHKKRYVYTYDLYCDEHGRINWGVWTGASAYQHPDFVWIPTQVGYAYQNWTNPCLNYQLVKQLIQPATTR